MGSWQEAYNANGFFEVKAFISPDRASRLKHLALDLAEKHPEYCLMEQTAEFGDIVHKLYFPSQLTSSVQDLVPIDEIQALVSSAWGEPAALLVDKFNFKRPGGRGFDAHQDMQGDFRLHFDNVAVAFLALDQSLPDNGCLELASGRHREGLFSESKIRIEEAVERELLFENMPQGPGDLLIFDGFTPHRSGANHSSRDRVCLLMTFQKSQAPLLREHYRRRLLENRR